VVSYADHLLAEGVSLAEAQEGSWGETVVRLREA
jgi:hypothetical protein